MHVVFRIENNIRRRKFLNFKREKKMVYAVIRDTRDGEFRPSRQQFVKIVYTTFHIELLYINICGRIYPYMGCSKLYQTFL